MHLNFTKVNEEIVGGELAWWLAHLTPDRAVRARALTGLILLLFLGKTLCSYIASLTYRPGAMGSCTDEFSAGVAMR